MSEPVIICLTPVKNEAWILDRFLKCTSLWADHIIIANQSSNDGSKEIARRYPKVILIDNISQTFNEPERQKLLIDEARKIPGPRILMALDADEILTANFEQNPEWDTALKAPEGTVIRFELINICPDLCRYWSYPYSDFPVGFVDDEETMHEGNKIHSPRIPIPDKDTQIGIKSIKVLHFQYTNWKRMKSKHRWYQCWERINNPHRSPVEIYRQYNHMYNVPSNMIKPLPEKWLNGYIKKNIDMITIPHEEIFYWDEEILRFFDTYGVKKFRRETIWDVDWSELSKKINPGKSTNYGDPRNCFEKNIHKWLKNSQVDVSKFHVRFIQLLLRFIGW